MKKFLALGDSYTIGTSVPGNERWPAKLAARLHEHGIELDKPQIIAQRGWTSIQLTEAIADTDIQPGYDLVSLMIGVNDQHDGYPKEMYWKKFVGLLNQAITFTRDDPGRVMVVSIPDWSVTPYAQNHNRTAVSEEIDAFNAINQRESKNMGVQYIDVTPTSRLAANQPDLLAEDGLHPSGKMYTLWVDLIVPVAINILKQA